MDQPGCAPVPVCCEMLGRGCSSDKSTRSGSSVVSMRAQLSLRLAKLALPSVGASAGEGGTELPKPAGVPVKSIADEEEDPPDSE